MTVSAAADAGVASTRPGWTYRSWAPWLMALAVLVFIAAPARIWLHAAAVSVGDATVSGSLLALWTFLGLLPITVGSVAWFTLRQRPAVRRFVLAALWACPVGMLTMIPITPYVFVF